MEEGKHRWTNGGQDYPGQHMDGMLEEWRGWSGGVGVVCRLFIACQRDMFVCVCVCVYVGVFVCVCARARACVRPESHWIRHVPFTWTLETNCLDCKSRQNPFVLGSYI